jgi:RNA polymerase sigma-70 factor (ECF subfamily)
MNPPSHRDWVLEALHEHELALTRYALRLLGNREQARDVVQHAFLKLCEQSSEKLGGGERQWLYAVCRNRALDLLRQNSRINGSEINSEGEAGWRDAVGREPDPASAAEQEELSDILARLVRELPATQREAIDLWREGFNYREIAEIIGRQEGNVRVLVHRGLAALREHPQVRAWLGESSRHAPRDVVPRDGAGAVPR